MTHRALGTICTFILLNCIKQECQTASLQSCDFICLHPSGQYAISTSKWRQDAEMVGDKKMEVLAGQDVALRCAIENSYTHVIMIEWSKNRDENEKLAVYSPLQGQSLFSHNVTLEVDSKTMVSYLHLHRVTTLDSGIYICGLSTFPLGSIRQETELKVTDVAPGTEKGFTESTDSTTSLTNQHSTVVTRTTAVPANATDGPNTSRGLATAGGSATSYTNDPQSRVTSAPATSPDLFNPSDHQGMRTTLNAFSGQTAASDASTRHAGSASISTREARDDTSQQTGQPEVKPSTSLEESSTLRNVTGHRGNTHAPTARCTGDRVSCIKEDGTQKHLLLLLTIAPALMFLALAAFLGRRWMKKRKDLPPPFKPPPPPVKYTSARYSEPSADIFLPPT